MKLVPYFINGAYNQFVPVNPGEPARSFWNARVITQNPGVYDVDTNNSDWMAGFNPTDTQGTPLPVPPVLMINDPNPTDNSGFGINQLKSDRPLSNQAAFRIDSIKDIAHTDRRGKLAKVFHIRLARQGTNIMGPLYAMRYNLNADGSRFMRIGINHDGTEYTAQLGHNLTGNNHDSSPPYPIGQIQVVQFADLKLVIEDDKIALRLDEPGSHTYEFILTEPLLLERGAHFVIAEEIPNVDYSNVVAWGIDGFDIYETIF